MGEGAALSVPPRGPGSAAHPRGCLPLQVHPFQRETLQVPGVREGLLPVQDPGGPQNPPHAGEPGAALPFFSARVPPARLGTARGCRGDGAAATGAARAGASTPPPLRAGWRRWGASFAFVFILAALWGLFSLTAGAARGLRGAGAAFGGGAGGAGAPEARGRTRPMSPCVPPPSHLGRPRRFSRLFQAFLLPKSAGDTRKAGSL